MKVRRILGIPLLFPRQSFKSSCEYTQNPSGLSHWQRSVFLFWRTMSVEEVWKPAWSWFDMFGWVSSGRGCLQICR